jgi:hypothetical protein
MFLLLARIPAKRNRFADKDSRQINILEQILIAKLAPDPIRGRTTLAGFALLRAA